MRATGSSPRGRGKPSGIWSYTDINGLIPAWAGKTSSIRPTRAETTAHPRVGGENAHARASASWPAGSSPRGRGKLSQRHPTNTPARLIPAWAGKTSCVEVGGKASGAHPRVGGENGALAVQDLCATGSSPRGRGKLFCCICLAIVAGLIPAWAGKTLVGRQKRSVLTAHPRVGGENAPTGRHRPSAWGSSPRGRGKLSALVSMM